MTTGKTIALTRRTFVGKVTSLLFNLLSRLVIAVLPRSKRLLVSWLQSPSAVILEPKEVKPGLFPFPCLQEARKDLLSVSLSVLLCFVSWRISGYARPSAYMSS